MKNLKYLHCVSFFMVFNCLTPALVAETTDNVPIKLLTETLFAGKALPTIKVTGSLEFFGVYNGASLEPATSGDFIGKIDLASRSVQFDFTNYKLPVYNSEPSLHTKYSVTFDGEKWTVTDYGSGTKKLPFGLLSQTKVSSERPSIYLKSLDQLCFPIFAPLLDVQVDEDVVPLLQILGGKNTSASITTKLQGSLFSLTVAGKCFTDELTFDVSKSCALVHRRTDFNGCSHPTQTGEHKLVNDMKVSEFEKVGEFWFPKAAEFVQTDDDKVTVRRLYKINSIQILANAPPIEAVVPPNSYVTDERFHIQFRTSDSEVK